MLYLFLTLLLTSAPIASVTAHTNKNEYFNHNRINTDQLKSWYDQKKVMVILDARTKPYFDGTLLPSAKWLPADALEKDIESAVPSKNSIIVVYCAGVECPAGGFLHDKLIKMGYKNVYEYSNGINEWIEKGYPTTKVKN
jgi:rhodanese-related sulfurtransferase